MQGNRYLTFALAAVLTWLLTLLAGVWGPLLAGLAAGRFAPRKGAFWWAFLGAFAAWMLWLLVSAAQVPIVSLAQLLGQIVGLGSAGGLALPVLGAIFAGIVAGTGCGAGRALFFASHPDAKGASNAS